MPETWMFVALAALVVIVFALAMRAWRFSGANSTCELIPPGRDGDLATRLAKMVGCSPRQALPAVQLEIDLAPSQSDEVILKRAAYHYRNALPEKRGAIYRDKVKG